MRQEENITSEQYREIIADRIQNAKEQNATILQLDKLKLTTETLKQLIPKIEEIQNLEVLDISHNELEKIPQSICNLKHLKIINAEWNMLTSLPKKIHKLKKLEKIHLGVNKFKKFPKELCRIESLQEISLKQNCIKSLFTGILFPFYNITKLKNLKSLNLNNNSIERIPEQVCQLSALKVLLIRGNKLKSLPKEIHKLEKLQTLNAADNRLQTIPNTLCDIPSLTELMLYINHLKSLPKDIHKLSQLQKLDCDNNKLKALPENTVALPENCEVHIANNPVEKTAQVLDDHRMARRTYGKHGALIATYNDRYHLLIENLKIIYPENYTSPLDQIEGMTKTSFHWGVPEPDQPLADLTMHTAKDTIKTFVAVVPNATDFDKEIYLKNVTASLLFQLLDPNTNQQSESTQKSLIATMASCLENCRTPIRSLLIQKYIATQCQEELLDPQTKALIAREAIEQKIITSPDIPLYEVETIEQVQGLLNALFSPEETSEYSSFNKVKIAGKRPELPSKTNYYESAFKLVRPETATAFARMLCKTDPFGKLEIQDDSYQLDPIKYEQITESYLAKLGFVSTKQKQIDEYQKAIQANPAIQELYINYYNKEEVAKLFVKEEIRQEVAEEVIELLNIPEQALALRARLNRLDAPSNSHSDGIEAYTKITQQFLSEQTSKAQRILKTIESAKKASAMSANKSTAKRNESIYRPRRF